MTHALKCLPNIGACGPNGPAHNHINLFVEAISYVSYQVDAVGAVGLMIGQHLILDHDVC